jgi:hypothetical protein
VNYIQRLTEERDDARKALRSARADLLDTILYLSSSKFAWPDNDYVRVRTTFCQKSRPSGSPC